METGDAPSNDLTCHLVAWVRKVPGETEIGNFELSVSCNEQVVGLEILWRWGKNPVRLALLASKESIH